MVIKLRRSKERRSNHTQNTLPAEKKRKTGVQEYKKVFQNLKIIEKRKEDEAVKRTGEKRTKAAEGDQGAFEEEDEAQHQPAEKEESRWSEPIIQEIWDEKLRLREIRIRREEKER